MLPTSPTGDDAVSGPGTVGAVGGNFTAPIIADPLPGSTIANSQPSLRVLNAAQGQRASRARAASAGADARTYLFQVSSAADFSTLEAQSGEVPEGGDGTTSWTVDRPLGDGSYFWRVRARSGATDSPFSSTAELVIADAAAGSGPPAPTPTPTPTPPPTGTIVSDPLFGGSIGEVNGGQFSGQGWTVTAPGNFIRYEVTPLSKGWVEFDTVGLRETNPSNDQFMLFGMWDPTAGPFRANPYRVNLQKLHPNPHNPPYLRLRWISNGEQHDEGDNFFAWNPQQVYHWRIQWGPAAGGGHSVQVRLDGRNIIDVSYSRAYRPNVHFIELGIGERGESIVGVTYSNFQIGS